MNATDNHQSHPTKLLTFSLCLNEEERALITDEPPLPPPHLSLRLPPDASRAHITVGG